MRHKKNAIHTDWRFFNLYSLFKPPDYASTNSIDRKCVHHIGDVIFSTYADTMNKAGCTSITIKACRQRNTYWGEHHGNSSFKFHAAVKRIFYEVDMDGRSFTVCASGSYDKTGTQRQLLKVQPIAAIQQQKASKKIMQSLPNTPILKQILTVAIQ